MSRKYFGTDGVRGVANTELTAAFALQLARAAARVLAPTVVGRLNEELGEESLRYMEVLGPRQKSWVKGKLRVKGRGPRDTYG